MLAATSSQDQWFQSGRRSQSLRGPVGQYFQNINTNFTESSYMEWGVSMDACFCGWGERVCYIYFCALIRENIKGITFCNLSSMDSLIAGGDAWIIIVGHGKSTSTLSVKVHWAGQTMWKKLVLQMRTSSILSVDVFIEQAHPSRNSEILADSFHTLQKNSWLPCLIYPLQAVLSVGKLEKGKDPGFKKIQVDVLSCHTSLANREAKLDIGIVLEGIICELGELATHHVQTCSKKR